MLRSAGRSEDFDKDGMGTDRELVSPAVVVGFNVGDHERESRRVRVRKGSVPCGELEVARQGASTSRRSGRHARKHREEEERKGEHRRHGQHGAMIRQVLIGKTTPRVRRTCVISIRNMIGGMSFEWTPTGMLWPSGSSTSGARCPDGRIRQRKCRRPSWLPDR